MSIIFGIKKELCSTASEEELREMASATRRYAAEGSHVLSTERIGMGFQPYHTHERSICESQPLAGESHLEKGRT
jgi:asparagine synthase (glutamine-hydrolysing)